MKRVVATALCAMTMVLSAQTVDRSKPMVVVISLDAFGAESLIDPRVSIPNLHKLMEQGSYARAMRPINPTITWPNHTTLVTGVDASRHYVMANGHIEGQSTPQNDIKVKFPSTKEELVHVPTVYDLAKQAGLTTAEVDWVAIHQAKNIDYAFEEIPDHDSVVVRGMLADGAMTTQRLEAFKKGDQTLRDQAYADAACYILKKYHPNLMLLHFLTLDSMEHKYGFGTTAAAAAIAYLDDRIQQIVNAVKDAGDLDRTTFLIVSDHGQMTVTHGVHVNAMLLQAGCSKEQARALPESGAAYIYAHHPDAVALQKLKEVFLGKEGIREALTPDQFATFGIALPQQNGQSPDLLLFAANGYSLQAGDDGPAVEKKAMPTGAHAYLNTEPLMKQIFIAEGRGIKKAGQISEFPSLDVAPTIAHLLGISMPGIQGHPLLQILK